MMNERVACVLPVNLGRPADILKRTSMYAVHGPIPKYVESVYAVLYASDTVLWILFSTQRKGAGPYLGLFVDVSHTQPPGIMVCNPNILTPPGTGYRMVPHRLLSENYFVQAEGTAV